MSGSDGGNSRPSDPAAVSIPSENRSRYRSARSAGSKSPPSARIVTPDPPVNVVKNAHRAAVTTAVPPGIHPKNARNSLSSRSEACPSASRNPASVKRGMAGRSDDVSWS